MPQDDDISRLLPRPPHPAPARRDAAIAEALRRFDGGGERPAAAPTQPRKAPLWGRISWPTASALAAAGVAALIALPLALSNMPETQTPDAPTAPAPTAPPPQALADASTAPTAGGMPDPASTTAPAAPSASPQQRTGTANAPPAAATQSPSAPAQAASPAPAPAQEPRPAPQTPSMAFAEAADAESIIVSGSRIARPELSATNPVAVVAEEDLDDPAGSITVTATRAPARGDWNACTVQDPARNLAACRNLIGRRGPAAAHLSEGLAAAWRGDDDQAIAAFDRAIAADPRSAPAHFNRALTRQRTGDEDGALADLNSALRLHPRSARLYYHRALLLRERGDFASARADEARAVRLNSAYAPLLRQDD